MKKSWTNPYCISTASELNLTSLSSIVSQSLPRIINIYGEFLWITKDQKGECTNPDYYREPMLTTV